VSQALFLIISALGLLAALGTVLSRNLVHAALYLVGFFFVIACQFVFLEAEFLAAIQVLVYIGAVAILLMFGIMLTRNVQGDDTTTPPRFLALPAVVVGLGLFLLLCFGIHGRIGREGTIPWRATQDRPTIVDSTGKPLIEGRAAAINNMGKAVGDEMLTRFVVPFEVAGLLLTAALVGAVALAFREGDDEPQQIRSRARAAAPGRPGVGTTLAPGSGNGQQPQPQTEALTQPASSRPV
jgi:NADH-quinone oxidoreductase subunit J